MAKKSSKPDSQLIPLESIQRQIYLIRNQRVILDSDLADLYGVSTKRLNEQVTRNKDRFPDDFMFRLTRDEFQNLKSQIATSSWGGRRYPPRAFSEHGALMAANVLNSTNAVQSSIQVIRTFIRLRELMATHKDLARKLTSLEKKYDRQFKVVFDAIRQLMEPDKPPKQQRIGFREKKK